jgi:hypothetical protein
VSLVTPRVETAIQAAYGLATMASALVVGATTRSEAVSDRSRLGQAIIWLALLNLASFRSPFLPDGYAYVGTLWLVTLLFAAHLRFSWRDALILTIAWVLLTPIYGGRDELPQPFTLLVAVTLLTQGLVIAGTLGAVWMEWRHAGVLRAPARTRSLEHQPA